MLWKLLHGVDSNRDAATSSLHRAAGHRPIVQRTCLRESECGDEGMRECGTAPSPRARSEYAVVTSERHQRERKTSGRFRQIPITDPRSVVGTSVTAALRAS